MAQDLSKKAFEGILGKNQKPKTKKTCLEIISPGKFTSLKYPFQVLFNIIWLVLVDTKGRRAKLVTHGKKERVHVSELLRFCQGWPYGDHNDDL